MDSPTIDARAYKWIRRVEGKLANVKGDRGGVTYVGLTAPALVGFKRVDGSLLFDFDKDGDVDAADIRHLASLPEAESSVLVLTFYESLWTKTVRGLPWPASLLCFDGATHSGPTVGALLVQQALNQSSVMRVGEDGIVGRKTIEAARMVTPRPFINAYHRLRHRFLVDICNARKDQVQFLHGWMNRVADLADYAERMP